MADWTAEGKDGRDGRGGRQQYNRNYRGLILYLLYILLFTCYLWWRGRKEGTFADFLNVQINRFTARELRLCSRSSLLKMNLPSPLSAILAIQQRHASVVAEPSLEDEASGVEQTHEDEEVNSSA